MTIVYILIAILIFGVLIIIHELGHFAAAKACGVRVEEFAVGMGPAIFKKQKGETTYSLRCIPFGGFCAMTGEDEESKDPRAFTNQAAWKRVIILAAGSFMNFVLGFVIVACLYANAQAFRVPVLAGFIEGCPYESAEGLQQGDRFYSIDGHRIYQYYDVSDFISKGDGSYDIVVIRDGKKVKLENFKLVPLEVLFTNCFAKQTADKSEHKAGNQQNRSNPHRHIAIKRSSIFRTIAFSQHNHIAFAVQENGSKVAKHPNVEHAAG